MDRPLDPDFVQQQRRRRLGFAVVATAGLVAAWLLLPRWLGPSITRERVRLAKVERGDLAASLSASGTVLPESEQALTSPVEARVLRVLQRPGATLAAGEPILELDVAPARLAVERLDQQIALRETDEERERLALERTQASLDAQRRVRALQLDSLEAQLGRNRKLHAEGLIAEEVLQQSDLAAAQARIELGQIEFELKNAAASTAARLRQLALEGGTLRQERAEAWRTLQRATARAERPGVLTFVVTDEGVTVRPGDVLARIADLTRFRVQATVSDVHAGLLRPGLAVRVRLGERPLPGRVTAVEPSVQGGAVSFRVALDDAADPALRPNLRVDVEVLTENRVGVLRVSRGPGLVGTGAQELFVVEGDEARRRLVRLGVASWEHVEVLEGLQEGEEVLVSDTSAFGTARRVRLR